MLSDNGDWPQRTPRNAQHPASVRDGVLCIWPLWGRNGLREISQS